MKMKKTSLNTTKVTDRKIKRLYLVAATVVAAAFVMAMPAFADDPLTTINNLSDFVFSAIKAIGAILLGFGIVQSALPSKARCQPAGARLYDVLRWRGHLLCKGYS